MSMRIQTDEVFYKKGYRYINQQVVTVQLDPLYFYPAHIKGGGNDYLQIYRDGGDAYRDEMFPTGNPVIVFQPLYAWDGASGPAINLGKKFVRPSLVHDGLYQLIGLGIISIELREAADMAMVACQEADGMCAARRYWTFQAVRHFGPKEGSPPRETFRLPAINFAG